MSILKVNVNMNEHDSEENALRNDVPQNSKITKAKKRLSVFNAKQRLKKKKGLLDNLIFKPTSKYQHKYKKKLKSCKVFEIRHQIWTLNHSFLLILSLNMIYEFYLSNGSVLVCFFYIFYKIQHILQYI